MKVRFADPLTELNSLAGDTLHSKAADRGSGQENRHRSGPCGHKLPSCFRAVRLTHYPDDCRSEILILLAGPVCQLWARFNHLDLRARLLHHFHQDFPGLTLIVYLPQEGDAGATHSLSSFQADMKAEAIDCGHRCFR
jgi:hypothetical protein